MEKHVRQLRTECADTQGLTTYMTSIRNLILSSVNCPGVQETHLTLAHDHCLTDGTDCSWECSAPGRTFLVGSRYGEIHTITNVPAESELVGRAFCQKHCVEHA